MLYLKPQRPLPPDLPPCPKDTHYLDCAERLLRLNAEGINRAELARMTGLTVQQVVDRMSLWELESSLRAFLRRENVPERTALSLLMLPDALTRRRIAVRIVREKLCIRDAGLLILSARRKCARLCQQQREQGQRVITLIRDVRPYRNAIRDIAGQMTAAGMQATFTEQRVGRFMELTIAYPARRRRTQRYQSM